MSGRKAKQARRRPVSPAQAQKAPAPLSESPAEVGWSPLGVPPAYNKIEPIEVCEIPGPIPSPPLPYPTLSPVVLEDALRESAYTLGMRHQEFIVAYGEYGRASATLRAKQNAATHNPIYQTATQQELREHIYDACREETLAASAAEAEYNICLLRLQAAQDQAANLRALAMLVAARHD